MSFSTQVGKWTGETAPDAVNDEMTAIVLDLFGSVIEDTPVLQGRLAGNWITSSRTPSTTIIDIQNPEEDESKARTFAAEAVRNVDDFVSKFDFSKKDFVVYLTNNLPYALRIEDGYSTDKAPEGMVRKNQIRVLQNIKARSL
jgi:hypothetical protein